MEKKISLIDFGAGNLHSVYKALKYIGATVEVTNDQKVIEKSDAIIFPGVGAFGAVMNSIRKNNLVEIITKSAKSTKPFLGICVGMQVLFEDGEENPGVKGLGIFKGKVVKFKKAKKIPHIGWNDVICRGNIYKTTACHPEPKAKDLIALGDCFVAVAPRNDIGKFYFVHSYYVVPGDKNLIYGTTNYAEETFTSAIKRENLLAVQFHPEKSGDSGLELLREFIKSID